MVKFCKDLEDPNGSHHDELQVDKEIVRKIAKWYCDNYHKYSDILKTELGYSQMQTDLNCSVSLDVCSDLSYENEAKVSPFNHAEALMKLILSKYSYGPSADFYQENGISRKGFDFTGNYIPWSWLSEKSNTVVMVELLAKVLKNAGAEYRFDLKALIADRGQRNTATHSAAKVDCLTVIRVYHSIRAMLTFLDPDEEDKLPQFTTSRFFVYNDFLKDPCSFNFDDYATIMIVDSVHDIREDHRQTVSNLPWDIVIDLDGYSDYGGLLNSVLHNRIQREVLTTATAQRSPAPNRGQTLWLRCGQYAQPNYFPNQANSIEISSYNTFVADGRQAQDFTKKTLAGVFEWIVEKALLLDRPLNIVAITDNVKIVENFIIALNSKDCEDYFLSWVGLSAQAAIPSNKYNDDDDENSHFRYLFCPTYQFFESFSEHKSSWAPRKAIKIDFALPGINGPVPLTENDRNNLESYFDVLYRGCEDIDSCASGEPDGNLIHGGRASWHSISCGDALPLMEESDLHRIIQKVKTTLGKTQDKWQQSLIFIAHNAGMGGTTLARQVAWKLHDDYAVLDVKRYDKQKTVALVQNLYDNLLGKAPIVILAEDTLPNIDSLCDDFSKIDRRCVLLISCRQNSGLHSKYLESQKEYFLQLSDGVIERLKASFKKSSPLGKDLLDKKYVDFDTDVSGAMKTPFIIGLYFMEKEFNIQAYISKAIDNVGLRSHAEMLACLAFCDKYNCKAVPASFVNKSLGLRRSQSFLRLSPGAASLICQNARANIEEYYFKHHLLSERYLETYCTKYYNSPDVRTMLVDLSKFLIRSIAAVAYEPMAENMLGILVSIIIQNKDGSEYDYSGELSRLLKDIGMPESQCDLINFLAETFCLYADRIRDEKEKFKMTEVDRQIFRLVSHAYAHLGKLYTKVIINYEMATENLQLAQQYMLDDDPVIYHMYGNAIYHKLIDEWRKYDDNGDATRVLFDQYQENVTIAYDLFDNACKFGSPQYGLTGQLNLLYEYLAFMYKVLDIKSEDDMKKLSVSQRKTQSLFSDTLEVAKSYDGFDAKAIQLIHSRENQFRSEIMMGNYGKTIEYYQNQVDRLKNGADILAWEAALQGLVSTRIRAAREVGGLGSLYHNISNPQDVFDNIQVLLQQPYDIKSYTEYVRRNILFHHWMQFAKVLKRPINEGLIKARDWLDAEEQMSTGKNPEPYYYQQALLYLDALDGAKRSADISDIIHKIVKLSSAQQFDLRRGRLDRMRDLIVSGEGMGKLVDITDCKTTGEIATRIECAKCDPLLFEGHFSSVVYNIAEFSIYSPKCWDREKVRSEIGRMVRNSLSEQQLNHSIMFYAGFSTRGLMALTDSVKDKTTNESFDKTEIIKSMKPTLAQEIHVENAVSRANSLKPVNMKDQNIICEFCPNGELFEDRYTGKMYLNGKIGNTKAGVSTKDILFYGDEVERHGGIDAIMNVLAKKSSIPCKIIRQDQNGNYVITIHEVNSDLSQLLNGEVLTVTEEKKPVAICSDAHMEVNPQEEKEALLDFKVCFRMEITSVHNSVLGTIVTGEGKTYAARTVGKLTKTQQKVLQGRKTCEVFIRSKDETGYIVRLK